MQSEKSFTLIELLIVVAIIGSIMAFAFSFVINAQKKARDFKRKKDLKQIQVVLEQIIADGGNYPPDAVQCDASKGSIPGPLGCDGEATDKYWGPGGLSTIPLYYMNRVPVDPINNTQFFYFYEPVQPDYVQYGITCPAGASGPCGYILSTQLENTSDPDLYPGCNPCYTPHNFCIVSDNVIPGAPC